MLKMYEVGQWSIHISLPVLNIFPPNWFIHWLILQFLSDIQTATQVTSKHRILVNKQSVSAENSFLIYVARSYSLICITKLNSWTFRDNLAALLADEVNNTSSPSPALRSNQEKRREAKQYKDRTTWFSQPSFALFHSSPFLVIQNKELLFV